MSAFVGIFFVPIFFFLLKVGDVMSSWPFTIFENSLISLLWDLIEDIVLKTNSQLFLFFDWLKKSADKFSNLYWLIGFVVFVSQKKKIMAARMEFQKKKIVFGFVTAYKLRILYFLCVPTTYTCCILVVLLLALLS